MCEQFFFLFFKAKYYFWFLQFNLYILVVVNLVIITFNLQYI